MNDFEEKVLETNGEFNEWFRKMVLENIRRSGDKDAEEFLRKEWGDTEEVHSMKNQNRRTDYSEGNPEVLSMIDEGRFDAVRAKELLDGTDLNSPIFVPFGSGTVSTTYLFEAVSANNLPAVKFLLANGADSNLNIPELECDCALWELQYLDRREDWRIRYEIAKLFFQHGADPDLICDQETFFHCVQFKIYNDEPVDETDWENTRHLYMLLIAYGGGTEPGEERTIPEGVDLNKIDDYEIEFHLNEKGFPVLDNLVDKEGNVIVEL